MRHLKNRGVRFGAVLAGGLLALTACGGGGSVGEATDENESKAAAAGGDCGEFNILVHPWVGYTADAYVVGAERIDAGSNPFVDTYGCTDHDIHRRRIRQPIAFRPPGRSVLQASPSAILILVPGVKERLRPQKPTLLARTLARVIQVVLVPVAAPAWAIEWILRLLCLPRFHFSV